MTSCLGNIFRVTGHLCGEFTGSRWIPRTNANGAELWCFFFICARINCWVNNREAGGLRRHRAHHDVFVMSKSILTILEHIYKEQILFESVLFLADASLGLPCLPLLGFCGKKKPIRYMLLISTTLLCCTMSLRNTYAHYQMFIHTIQ